MAQTYRYDVIVVGGGASGMMAAATLGSRGKRVLLLEKNKKLGEKLRISGGGRCNILNAEEDTRILLEHFGEAQKFLFSPFSVFGMKETWNFFESNGLPLIVEDRKRAFPQSENAEDVCAFFEKLLQENKVEIRKKIEVLELVKRSGKITQVRAEGVTFESDTVVLATGGVSHPETGSTGDGFAWLEKLGHTVEKPEETIVPIRVEEKWIRELSGTTLKDIKVTFTSDTKKFSKRGDILITHFGFSGPTILNSAPKVHDLLYEGRVHAHLDLFPDMDHGALDEMLQKLFEEHKNKNLENALKELLPAGTAKTILIHFGKIDEQLKVHSVTKEQRKALGIFLKKITVTIPELMNSDRAVIANGGVPLSEIDTKTMRSTVIENLFITGDLFHITRPTGGYSLQLCWTSGYIAGMNA